MQDLGLFILIQRNADMRSCSVHHVSKKVVVCVCMCVSVCSPIAAEYFGKMRNEPPQNEMKLLKLASHWVEFYSTLHSLLFFPFSRQQV